VGRQRCAGRLQGLSLRLFAGRVWASALRWMLEGVWHRRCAGCLKVVVCGMIRAIVWEYVGDVFSEVDLKILHIVAKNSSRHF